jgi:hypothetical protein
MFQGPNSPIIAPGAILSSQTHDQSFQVCVDLGAAWGLPLWRAVKLLGDELAVPGENRVRLDQARHLLQRLLPQFLAELGQRLTLPLAQPDAPCDLVAQNAIFHHQVLVT